MNWRILKAFPKYAIAIGVVLLSTGLFGAWWFFKRTMPRWEFAKPDPAVVAEIKKKAEELPDKLGWLALVGGDLYDISTGEVIFKNWLRGIPMRVFYYPESRHLMVQAERGIMRFGLDGKQDGVMGVETPPAFTNDGSQAMYVKDGDIWIAGIDWTAFKFINERQATHYGQFNALYFSANLSLASEKACLVNQQGKLLRVDLSTGDLQQISLPLHYNMKRRSPDCEVMLGEEEASLFAFDIDKPEAAMFPKSAGKVSDYQWLNNNACAFLLPGKTVGVFDRKKGTIEEVATLPFDCQKFSMPSLDGRYLLCFGGNGLVLVDVQAKKAESLDIKADNITWVSHDTLIYSREIPDMKLRGTWIKTIGSEPQRVLAEPYLVGYDKSAPLALMRELGVVVFATRNGIFRMKPDGSELREVAKLKQPVGRIQAVEMWGKGPQ
ncbi:hypothetical protein [Prosthecobacter sp.]|uniref:hypothetical protein n=1 Tax=Prosthecobacter sp. TaxID=1965333 RepID=UPI002ABC4A37|nr:hypothetical protein [Prosthecobacter sp.]MDZ4405312.1 hypothetical protein [Prosthecobacter sp.]